VRALTVHMVLRPCEDAAHLGVGAVDRIGHRGPLRQSPQDRLRGAELVQAPVDVLKVPVDECGDVGAGGGAGPDAAVLQASARPHPRISHAMDYRQHHTRIGKFSKHHPNEPRSVHAGDRKRDTQQAATG
jgi:hypothetical protein